MDPVAPFLVGQAHNNGIGHFLVLFQHRFHLGREHILAAGDDHVAAPVGKIEVALFVQPAHVSHALEAAAVALQLRHVLVVNVQIPVAPAHVDLADLAGGQLLAVLIPDRDVAAFHFSNAALMLQPVVAPDIGHADALGHGVDLVQALRRDDLQPLELQVPGADAPGVGHGGQACQILLTEVRQPDDALHQRGHHLHIFDLILLDEPDNVGRVKGRGHHQSVAAVQTVEGDGVGRPVEQGAGQKLTLLKGHAGIAEPAVQTRAALAGGGVLLDDLGLSGSAAGAV